MSTRSERVLISAALLLGAVYIVFFLHPFGRHNILVSPTLRPAPGQPSMNVLFALDRGYHLTRVKVVQLDPSGNLSTNAPVWSLISETNAPAVRALPYGHRIAGMKPTIPKQRASPLEPGKVYRLFVEAGNYKGQIDFKTVASR